MNCTCKFFTLAGLLALPLTADAGDALVEHIAGYWRDGEGRERVPQRSEALQIVQPIESLDAVIDDVRRREEGREPLLVTTAARSSSKGKTSNDWWR